MLIELSWLQRRRTDVTEGIVWLSLGKSERMSTGSFRNAELVYIFQIPEAGKVRLVLLFYDNFYGVETSRNWIFSLALVKVEQYGCVFPVKKANIFG
jgi:hypothetical protein